jgi:NAD(P)-dependent dehydrogenase (short-subunit alcohol dehydrogenase family)
MGTLEGQVVIVTASSRGIGRAMALGLSRRHGLISSGQRPEIS